jgi:hypothetical protein
MPMLLSPDETAHMDYAFALYDAGVPYVVHGAKPKTLVTPQMLYLADALEYRKLRYSTLTRVRPGYGTQEFDRRLDGSAPKPSRHAPADGSAMPYVMFSYPVGYYTLLVCAMLTAGALDGNSLTGVYFAARFVNVALLAATLTLAFAAFRAHRLEPRTAALATLGLGTFPLVSWVAGYAQPDNMTATLVAAAVLLSATSRRRGFGLAALAYLGCTLSILFFTKQHYAAAAYVATVPATLTKLRGAPTRTRAAFVLVFAVVPLAAAYLSFHVSPVGALADAAGYVSSIASGRHASSVAKVSTLAASFTHGIVDAFLDGTGFESFWFRFGVRGGTIFPRPMVDVLSLAFQFLTVFAWICFASGSIWFISRLARIARLRSPLAAARLAMANVPVAIYVLTTFSILLIYSMTGGGLALQGRYWLPVMVPLIIIILSVMPRGLELRRRRVVAFIVAAVFSAYSIGASGFALAAIDSQYYSASRDHSAPNSLSDVETLTAGDRTTDELDGIVTMPRGDLILRGYDVDSRSGLPARGIIATIDARVRVAGIVGIARPGIASTFHDDALRNAGFEIRVPATLLTPGHHSIRITLNDPRLGGEIRIARELHVAVLP